MTEDNRCKNIRYIDFINMFNVKDINDWYGMIVNKDGVWIPPLQSDPPLLFPEERRYLLKHPDNDPTIPALKFPCSYVEVQRLLKHAADHWRSWTGPESESEFWTISGDELIRRWNINADMIAQFVLEKGLPVRDSISLEIFNVESHKTRFGNHWFGVYFKEGPLNRFLFRPSDINTFEKQHKNVIEELERRGALEYDCGSTQDEDKIEAHHQTMAVSNHIAAKKKPDIRSKKRTDALNCIIIKFMKEFREKNDGNYPKSIDVLYHLKSLIKNKIELHKVIQEIKTTKSGQVIYWIRSNGKEAKTSFNALQKRLSGIKKVQKNTSL